jgi:hypothetical protein
MHPDLQCHQLLLNTVGEIAGCRARYEPVAAYKRFKTILTVT